MFCDQSFFDQSFFDQSLRDQSSVIKFIIQIQI